MLVAIEIVAIPALLYWGRSSWFGIDDWDFLADRRVSVTELFRGHYEHWTTIPLLIYRALFALFGIHQYWPYQVIAIGLHLVAAFLLRVVMCRAGVRGWLATLGTTLFVFFAGGSENFLVAFQMTFLGSFVLGLGHLLLADHDGPLNRRDAAALCAGAGALMCSGVGVPMVATVGLAMVTRRGWRAAALQTVPLAALFLAWSALAPEPLDQVNSAGPVASRIGSFVWIGIQAPFRSLGFAPFVGVLIAAVIPCGLAVSWRSARRHLVIPATLAAGAILFLFLTAWGRSGYTALETVDPRAMGPLHAEQSRYVYIVAALLLPLIMVTAQSLMDRWRPISFAAPAVLALSIPVNIDRLAARSETEPVATCIVAPTLTAIPTLPVARELPRSLRPQPNLAGHVTIGWLVDHADEIPRTILTPAEEAALTQYLRAGAPPGWYFPVMRCRSA